MVEDVVFDDTDPARGVRLDPPAVAELGSIPEFETVFDILTSKEGITAASRARLLSGLKPSIYRAYFDALKTEIDAATGTTNWISRRRY